MVSVYVPSSLVVAVWVRPVPVFCAVTLAPEMEAPLGSVTVPLTDAFVVCARIDAVPASSNTSRARRAEPLRKQEILLRERLRYMGGECLSLYIYGVRRCLGDAESSKFLADNLERMPLPERRLPLLMRIFFRVAKRLP